MKNLLLALTAAILIAGQFFTPVAAAPSSSAASSTGTCEGTTYIVKPKDTLTSIAAFCKTTVKQLLTFNPQITNPNVLHIGQVIRIAGSKTINQILDETGLVSPSKYPRVTLSAATARPGDGVTVYVSGFPPNSWIDYRVGKQGQKYSVVYDGTIASNGTASFTIGIPYSAYYGEYWVVLVTTTSQKVGVQVTSPSIYISY